jgi:hypothetical protein
MEKNGIVCGWIGRPIVGTTEPMTFPTNHGSMMCIPYKIYLKFIYRAFRKGNKNYYILN